MKTASEILTEMEAETFEDSRDQAIAETIVSIARDLAEHRITEDEYLELMDDLGMEERIANVSKDQRRLQDLYALSLILVEVATL